jgi:hypothetical protein
LGDTIEKITKATGIDQAVKFIAGEDCGCDQRKDKLNALFPYKEPLCMTEDEFQWWTNFRAQNSPEITANELDRIAAMHSRIFHKRNVYRPCTCNPREWQRLIDDLNKIFETYGDNK